MEEPYSLTTLREQLRRLGFSDQRYQAILTQYAGCPNTDLLTKNQQRRLFEDLQRFVRIARKCHYIHHGFLS